MAKSAAFSLIISSFTQLLWDKFSSVSACENKVIFRPFIQQIYFKISQSSTSSHALNKWWNAEALQKCKMLKARQRAVKQHIFQFCCAECWRNWIFFFSSSWIGSLRGWRGLIVHQAQTCVPRWLISEDELQNTEPNTEHVAAEQNPPWKSLNLAVSPSLWLNRACNPKTFYHCSPPPL